MARVMSKPAARPAKPSVLERASMHRAAMLRSRDVVLSTSSDLTRSCRQMGTASGQPPSDASPSSARRSSRRASSRRSRSVERMPRPASLACRSMPEGLSPASGWRKLFGSKSNESGMVALGREDCGDQEGFNGNLLCHTIPRDRPRRGLPRCHRSPFALTMTQKISGYAAWRASTSTAKQECRSRPAPGRG